MRLIEFDDLKPGMVIADDFYGLNGGILAKKGVNLSEKYITNLSNYEIPYLYIVDEYSQDIHVQCSIPSEMRNRATQNLKRFYMSIRNGRTKDYHECMEDCLKSVDELTEVIINDSIDIYDVFDIKMIENYQYQQPVNVMIISLIIGKSLQLSSIEMHHLAIGAFFHDIGNMFIPEEILFKEGKVTDAEYVEIQKHAEKGYHFCKDEFNLPMRSYLAVLQHHERYDGTGYPTKKAGEDISAYGRIVAIADVFDALSSSRHQRKALHPAQAFKMIIQGMETQFDPQFVKAFADRISPYPIGYTLKLPEDKIGIVVENFQGKPFNPMIRIIEEKGQRLKEPYMMDLD